MAKKKNIDTYVVIVHRDRYIMPKLTVTVELVTSTVERAVQFVTQRLWAAFRKKKFRGTWPMISIPDYRIVDGVGLKRLYAAAKASATLRRKRGAQKAALTRARNRLPLAPRQ